MAAVSPPSRSESRCDGAQRRKRTLPSACSSAPNGMGCVRVAENASTTHIAPLRWPVSATITAAGLLSPAEQAPVARRGASATARRCYLPEQCQEFNTRRVPTLRGIPPLPQKKSRQRGLVQSFRRECTHEPQPSNRWNKKRSHCRARKSIIIPASPRGTDGLRTRMRRSTRLGLVILAALLVAGGGIPRFGSWSPAASRLVSSTGRCRNRPTRSMLSWQKIRVSGYPAAFRVDLGSAALRDGAITPSPELHIPMLSGTARPWNFSDWQLEAPEGFTADFASRRRRPGKADRADRRRGCLDRDRGRLDTVADFTGNHRRGGRPVLVGSAHATLAVPSRPSRGSAHPLMSLAVEASRIKLPAAIGPLGDTIDELDFGVT